MSRRRALDDVFPKAPLVALVQFWLRSKWELRRSV
ncbi:unnamed protein product [Ectocarpus sp. 12 AP-2014]